MTDHVSATAPPQLLHLSIPFCPPDPDGYGGSGQTIKVEARCSGDQAVGLSGLAEGLDRANARLANGQRVISRADAIRWITEHIAAAFEGQV